MHLDGIENYDKEQMKHVQPPQTTTTPTDIAEFKKDQKEKAKTKAALESVKDEAVNFDRNKLKRTETKEKHEPSKYSRFFPF